MAKKQDKKPTTQEQEMEVIRRTLFTLDHVTNALNTACLALAYCMNIKGDELDKLDGEGLVKFTQEHMHPLIRRADEIVREVAEKASASAEEAVETLAEEEKKDEE